MNTSELVQSRHLNRHATIYVRQSSPNQVVTNKESQRMQYALRDRAAILGWHQQDIRVIEEFTTAPDYEELDRLLLGPGE